MVPTGGFIGAVAATFPLARHRRTRSRWTGPTSRSAARVAVVMAPPRSPRPVAAAGRRRDIGTTSGSRGPHIRPPAPGRFGVAEAVPPSRGRRPGGSMRGTSAGLGPRGSPARAITGPPRASASPNGRAGESISRLRHRPVEGDGPPGKPTRNARSEPGGGPAGDVRPCRTRPFPAAARGPPSFPGKTALPVHREGASPPRDRGRRRSPPTEHRSTRRHKRPPEASGGVEPRPGRRASAAPECRRAPPRRRVDGTIATPIERRPRASACRTQTTPTPPHEHREDQAPVDEPPRPHPPRGPRE